ncbi:YggS family pyridoxal phosphate-dependent enzyme [Kiritimatiella glycovorans]|uniref:Pyridoxal phosphate homeostasis protein n=1 Tax=Kiritimatiella glycovorans TaxID=1307763 RepID=A0A0G3ECY4_9BACT|nr:YggS family pyridoxal phosphate-dependent enzyme [Kiritimatiella glycovorans]AKJ64311.1 pyridoxal phosphate enzyme, YggS family [Kiritimatiella glycovorans]
MMPAEGETIGTRIDTVRQRIAEACDRSGRDVAGVRLMAVSKTRTPEEIADAAECGLTLFGENKVQEAASKIVRCPGTLEWHLVGHLQRNKVRRALPLFTCIQSVDSRRLIDELDKHATGTTPVLLQINIAGEAAKHGADPAEARELVDAVNATARLEVHGLMTIPPFAPEPEKSRPWFAQLRELRDRLTAETGTPLPELSMGMSNDYAVAIEEGATLVRVGTAIFGKRK